MFTKLKNRIVERIARELIAKVREENAELRAQMTEEQRREADLELERRCKEKGIEKPGF